MDEKMWLISNCVNMLDVKVLEYTALLAVVHRDIS